MSDRTVHAWYPGMEIVRYNRAGKWYLEPTDPTLKRQAVTLNEAVQAGRWAFEHGGVIYFGKLGGGAFEARVREFYR